MAAGIVVGTFSSIFIASPVLLWLSQFEEKSGSKVPSTSSVNTRDLAATK
jgi:preprotein translocase subunit SecF